MDHTALFAAAGIALYAGHHVGDYWVQTDHEARHKGDAGWYGALICLAHCLTYLAVQAFCLGAMVTITRASVGPWSWQTLTALALSGVTHYAADRRERGLMSRLARRLPGKADFLKLGVPRTPGVVQRHPEVGLETVCTDNPQLATGAWALDQAWHIFFGVFGAALVLCI